MKNRFNFLTSTFAFGLAFQSFAASANLQTVDQQFIQGAVDLQSNTIMLPLHVGALQNGRKVYYVLTSASDKNVAASLGLGYSPSLKNAIGIAGTRTATVAADGSFIFNAGSVDFSPLRNIVPGDAPNAFPPKEAHAGAVADADYSPYVDVNGVVYSAPILAFNVDPSQINFPDGNADHALVHDKVVKIDTVNNLVTIQLTSGFADGKSVVYFSFDASVEVAATMEGAVLAPALSNLMNHNVDLDIYAIANGATGKDNPNRQGFNSALMGEGSPLNILEGLPTVNHGYSPLWNLNIAVFTDAAIAYGEQNLITGDQSLLDLVNDNFLTGPGGATFGPVGIEINCPVVATLK